MKILLVGDFPPPSGGVATHVEELFRAVRARGGECEVLDIGKGQLPADGVIPAGGVGRFSALLASRAAAGFRIHLHTSCANPKSLALISACAAAGRAAGRPPIVTLHSGLCPAWLAESPLRRATARAALRQYGSVIAVNEEIRAAIGVPDAEVIPAFSAEFLFPGAPPPGLVELRAASSSLFCAMASPRPEYGLPVLLTAFDRVRIAVPSAALALYGTGTEGAKAPGVCGFGEVLRPQALALIAACDVFVRPTLADGDSVSVREALALGRVVVATRVGHRPADVRLVPPADADALAKEMIAAATTARPVQPVRAPAHDGLPRILSLYGWTPPAPRREAPAREEAAPCAASAAS
ncbi:MAG: glycosyltransferase [Myxococcales bacterium]|nr:glycosyltransferase [Myxococcales bacterium]